MEERTSEELAKRAYYMILKDRYNVNELSKSILLDKNKLVINNEKYKDLLKSSLCSDTIKCIKDFPASKEIAKKVADKSNGKRKKLGDCIDNRNLLLTYIDENENKKNLNSIKKNDSFSCKECINSFLKFYVKNIEEL